MESFWSQLVLLNPAGLIALQQKDLLVFSFLLMLVVVIPVFILTAFFAWKYRAGNTHAHYIPNWDHNVIDEAIWWAVPTIIIAILGTLAWTTTHELDPYKPIVSETKPLTIQVVALDWKWLFIYPEQGIATVNYLEVPENTPLNFKITADAPMNSFWIPKLGGQIYAMAGMQTQLHLIAEERGVFEGLSANFSGEGFAGMNFKTHSVSKDEFDAWVLTMKAGTKDLTLPVYETLVPPTTDHPVETFAHVESNLFASILAKYMSHGAKHELMQH